MEWYNIGWRTQDKDSSECTLHPRRSSKRSSSVHVRRACWPSTPSSCERKPITRSCACCSWPPTTRRSSSIPSRRAICACSPVLLEHLPVQPLLVPLLQALRLVLGQVRLHGEIGPREVHRVLVRVDHWSPSLRRRAHSMQGMPPSNLVSICHNRRCSAFPPLIPKLRHSSANAQTQALRLARSHAGTRAAEKGDPCDSRL